MNTNNEATEATHESHVIDEEGELLQLEPTNLGKIIRNLKYATITEDIASKRDFVVNILNSLTASTTAPPSLEVKSSQACTTSPEINRARLPCTAAGEMQLRTVNPTAKQSKSTTEWFSNFKFSYMNLSKLMKLTEQ